LGYDVFYAMLAKQTFSAIGAALLAGGLLVAQGPQPNVQGEGKKLEKPAPSNAGQSPAAKPRPKTVTPQTYTAEQIRAGELRFGAQCGFCHGRDAAGGESGPDLTRSDLVAHDIRGDQLGPLLRAGRAGAGMPSFQLSDTELTSIAAFVHRQMDEFSSLGGGRRSVEPEDLATGNVADGRAYFNGEGGCSGCHSATGDLAGIAGRYQGLTLLRRMLYPSGRPAPAQPRAIITQASGQTVVLPVTAQDEFTVTVKDPRGALKIYRRNAVNIRVENPMAAHFDQLGKYTDSSIHNILAYLDTLK
jgi:cytochrome c oxidase cbb3-type subunit 3